MLYNELAISENVRRNTTRKAVIQSIKTLLHCTITYTNTGNGLVIFSNGTFIEPTVPLAKSLYYCPSY